MRPALLALLLLTPALVGCLGGGDDALDPSSADGAGEVPTLPEGLEMEGAEVVEYNETTAIWRWNGTIGPGAYTRNEATGSVGDVVETTFEVPAGVPFALRANVTKEDDGRTILHVRVEDEAGERICSPPQQPNPEWPPLACTVTVDALDSSASWLFHMESDQNLHTSFPFTLTLTLTTGTTDAETTRAQAAPDQADPKPAPSVLAFQDTGINPYHQAFRDDSPEAYQHPSTYIDGYPEDAKALELTLDAPTHVQALAADRDVWDQVEEGQLYWVPGTRIVGAILPEGGADQLGSLYCQPILDCYGHGTAVISRGASATYGSCPTCKIVAVQGFEPALAWTAQQPWIDASSNSWFTGDPLDATGDREADESLIGGKPTFFGSGNGLAGFYGVLGMPSMYWRQQAAPSSIVVGGHDNGRVAVWPGSTPQVVADVCPEFARFDAMAGSFWSCGTSYSPPYVAGATGELLLEARTILGDHVGGVDSGVLARGEAGLVPQGPIADGELTTAELKELLFSTAEPRPSQEENGGRACEPTDGSLYCVLFPAYPVEWQTIPEDVPAYYFIGYGAVNEDTLEDAKRVLRGEEPMPERPVEDAVFALDQEVRRALVEVDP